MNCNNWNGFKIYEFLFEGRQASIVFPDVPVPGKHWCMKTEYRDAFPDTEIELLKNGYHIAFIQNKTRWCLDEDLDLKKRFADFLIAEYGLAEKFTPVGMSCGGMIAIKFTAKYPQYISSIYLDAPVINLLSCPAGLGVADNGMFEEFYNATGMGLTELISYREHPLDKFDTLAENNIPIIMVYGTDDMTVPYAENGGLLEKYYSEHNGRLIAIGKDGCGHHPHGLDDPSPIVNFILENNKKEI